MKNENNNDIFYNIRKQDPNNILKSKNFIVEIRGIQINGLPLSVNCIADHVIERGFKYIVLKFLLFPEKELILAERLYTQAECTRCDALLSTVVPRGTCLPPYDMDMFDNVENRKYVPILGRNEDDCIDIFKCCDYNVDKFVSKKGIALCHSVETGIPGLRLHNYKKAFICA